jgi:Autographiviridae endonuclease VII
LLKKNFGLTNKEYKDLLKKQNYSCAICEDINPDGKRLAVDHNHITGEIRGLLCNSCNTGLGKFLDSQFLLNKASKYVIKEH